VDSVHQDSPIMLLESFAVRGSLSVAQCGPRLMGETHVTELLTCMPSGVLNVNTLLCTSHIADSFLQFGFFVKISHFYPWASKTNL